MASNQNRIDSDIVGDEGKHTQYAVRVRVTQMIESAAFVGQIRIFPIAKAIQSLYQFRAGSLIDQCPAMSQRVTKQPIDSVVFVTIRAEVRNVDAGTVPSDNTVISLAYVCSYSVACAACRVWKNDQ